MLLFNYFTESLVPFVFKALFCILYFWGVGGGGWNATVAGNRE